MNIPTDAKASIEKHLQAVRANLGDKEESIQTEILDGLRDHINESLARGGEPVTLAKTEAILAAMDDPASYAEDPVNSAPFRSGVKVAGNKWFAVALACLAINAVGVWKLGRNAGRESAAPVVGQVTVPHVTSADKSGIRYPATATAPAGDAAPSTPPPATEQRDFCCVAFLDNKNPVLLRSDQELSWLFNADAVAEEETGKALATPPVKFNPEVAGEFRWSTPRRLVFKSADPWSMGRAFTAELSRDFGGAGGRKYEGGRFWRFGTAELSLDRFTQERRAGMFSFQLGFSTPVSRESLAAKLKLFYLDANGEKHPLPATLKPGANNSTIAIETNMVPAISFVCEIDQGLQPEGWQESTPGRLGRTLQNSSLMSLISAGFEQAPGGGASIGLVFSGSPDGAVAGNFIEVSPTTALTVTKQPRNPDKLSITGDFVRGTVYEIKVRGGLPSIDGSVLPYQVIRNLALPRPADDPAAANQPPKPPFQDVEFSPRDGTITQGDQVLHWNFRCNVVPGEKVGKSLAEPPVKLSPEADGTFFWASQRELVFKPNTEWRLDQAYEARLSGELTNLDGTAYSGVRFWNFRVPPLTLLEASQIGGGGRNIKFGLKFSILPDPASLKDHLKVFCHAADGKKSYLPISINHDYYNSLAKIAELQLPPASRLYFELEPGFRPAKWAQEIKTRVEVPAAINTTLKVLSVTGSGSNDKATSIIVEFSESVDVKSAPSFIEITPPVKFTLQKDANNLCSLRLLGRFSPDVEYQVKVKAGLTSEFGYLLSEESTTAVTIRRAAAALGFTGAGGYLSPTGSLLVPFTHQNLSSCEVFVAPVMANNLVHFSRGNSRESSYDLPSGEAGEPDGDGDEWENRYYRRGYRIEDSIGNVTRQELALTSAMNEESTGYLKLGDLTNGKGAYLVQIRGKSQKNEDGYNSQLSDSRLVVVTNLGISAKCSGTHVFAWVCSLGDAKPAGGVEVTAFSANNQMIGQAMTNADGVAAIACNTSDKSRTPFLLTAKMGDDLSYLRLDGDPLETETTESTRDYRTDGCEAFVFTDRGIFRPGETLHARTLVRKADFTAPAPFPVVFEIIKPDGRPFKELTAMTNACGTAEIETLMPEYLPTGRYTVRLRVPKAKSDLGNATFLMEDFVPPQIRVSVATDPERVAAGKKLAANVFAEHLFGAPAAGLKVNVKCLHSPVEFAPKQWSDYRFGQQAAHHWAEVEGQPFSMKPQDIENLTLDENGKVTTDLATAIPANAPGPIQLQVQATVFEPSGRPITAAKKAVIDPYPFYIGIKRTDRNWLKSGESHKISVIASAPDGTAFKPEQPLLVRLSRIDWNYNYKRTPSGSYSYVAHKAVTLLKEESLDLSSGSADYAFVPTGYGQNELSVTDPVSGSSSSFVFYASDYEQSWTSTQRDKPDSLTLKLDKPEYAAGETARLTIQSPFAGTALLTIESGKVLQSRVILLEKNTAEVDLEVKDSYAPNVHCTVSVIRPAVAESAWKGHRAFGSLPLKVSPRAHRLNVAIEAPPTVLPQGKLKTKIRLTDDAGHPVDGELTLVAVDEAICMLTSFKTPSPLGWLYELRRLGVESHDVYSDLMEVIDAAALAGKSKPGGDGDDESGGGADRLTRRLNPIKANRFKPVSLWASNISVTNGEAEVDLDVPEFTGELRLMAVACNAKLLGSAQGMVKVKRPLIVQPSLPRFLAPNDECLMDVTVFNETGKDITARLRVTCGGPLSTSQNEQHVAIRKGGSASVTIPMVAGKLPGKALCTVSCEADSVKFSDTVEIAVRPPVSAEVIADSGLLEPGKTLELRAPANWLPESALRRLQVSREPTLELGHGLQYLLQYPYGCVEQTTSGAFPLLYLPDLANRTHGTSMNQQATREYVMSGVWRLLAMQQADGSFSYWPGYNQPCVWGTSYATHFLVEAKKAGYEVPQGALDRAVKAVREGLDTPLPTGDTSRALDYDQRAYACYVLAVAGAPQHPWQARMLEMQDRLSYYARLMNASALLIQGEPKRAVAMLKELGLPGTGQRDQGGCFNSPNRNAALLLSAWLDIDPNNSDVSKLVHILGKAKINGRWGTTQDNAMALMALGKYARRIRQESKDFKAMVTLPDGTTEVFDQSKDHKWSVERGATGAILLTNQGPGNLYYSFESEGLPVDLPEYYKKLGGRNTGMTVKREWLDGNGNPIDITKLKQNDVVVAKLTLDPHSHLFENVAIEDLLPAGLEIENPNLDTAQSLPWIKEKSAWCARIDIRDDRILLFTRPVTDASVFYYLARAVTPGKYVVPPVSAECMYDPEVRSVTSQTEMTITK